MGLSECDDGNRISEDGCSSNCQIEENYECSGGNNTHPDICLETIPPLMTSFSQINKGAQLSLTFSEYVQFKGALNIYIIYIYIYSH